MDGLTKQAKFAEVSAPPTRCLAEPVRPIAVLLVVALVVVWPAPCLVVISLAAEDERPLDFRMISLNGDKGGMLAVVEGQPRLVNSRSA